MSTLEVKAIQAPTGYDLQMPAGHILQVVYAAGSSSSVAVSPASSGFSDGPLEISITPTSTSNKILVFGQQALRFEFTGNNGRGGIRVERKIGSGSYDAIWNTDNLREMAQAYDRSSGSKEFSLALPFNVLDTPNTTSALTYKITGGMHNDSGASTMYMWRGTYGSTMTAMEVSG